MNTSQLLALLAFGSAGLSAATVPAPLILWTFDEGEGGHTFNRGTAGEADLNMRAPGGDPTEAFSLGGNGVSGKVLDHAFDLTTATGMGATTPNSTGPTGVVWSSASGIAALSGVSSFTISGWLKPTATIANAARIIASQNLVFFAGAEGSLTLQVNGQNAEEQSMPVFNEVGNWTFFAVTYDSTRKTKNVTYYVGTPAKGSLTQAGITTLVGGPLKPTKSQLMVGNNSSTDTATSRPFMGLIDQLALHGSKADASGALSADQIEAIRAAAVR